MDIVTIGKCAACKMEVMQANGQDKSINPKLKDYNITSVPSIVIDGRIKVAGVPTFPWFCGEEFYKFLEEKYSLLHILE